MWYGRGGNNSGGSAGNERSRLDFFRRCRARPGEGRRCGRSRAWWLWCRAGGGAAEHVPKKGGGAHGARRGGCGVEREGALQELILEVSDGAVGGGGMRVESLVPGSRDLLT